MSWLIFANILLLAMLINEKLKVKRLENIINELDKWLLNLRAEKQGYKIIPSKVRTKLYELLGRYYCE